MQTSLTYCSLCLYQAKMLIPLRDDDGKASADILDTVHKNINIMLTSSDCICANCWANVEIFRKFCLLIAERQASYVCQAKDSKQDTALKYAVEKQAAANLSSNDGGNVTEPKQPTYVEEVRNSVTTVAHPASESQDNTLQNRREMHSQLNKTETPDLFSQQTQKCTKTHKNTEAEGDTSTLPDTESGIIELDAHARSQTAENKLIAKHMQLVCEVCKFEAKCFTVLKEHYKQLHNSNGYVVCCQKRFYKRGILLDHINVHRNPAYFSCTDCDTNFADRFCLRNHMLLKHTNCAAQDTKQQQCGVCAKSFANAVRLQAHMKNVHDNSKLFVCKHCGHEVSGKQCYVRHLAQHGAQIEPSIPKRQGQSIQCTVCDQWLAYKSSLRLHMQRHTDTKSMYACPFCDKKKATRVALNAHKRLCHGNEQQQHVCQVCARNFNTTRRLREHMTTHTGEHLYSCNYCDKRFKCSSNLHAHRKWKHPTEWAQDQSGKTVVERK